MEEIWFGRLRFSRPNGSAERNEKDEISEMFEMARRNPSGRAPFSDSERRGPFGGALLLFTLPSRCKRNIVLVPSAAAADRL